MATLSQIEANRLNAVKSTGPRSAEGKAASRFNALKTGIDAESMVIPGEDPRVLEELAAEYHERFEPSTPDHRFLVDTLVNAEWQLRRLRKIEAQLWRRELEAVAPQDREFSHGVAFRNAADPFARLQRRIDAAERVYRRALDKLERSQPATPFPDLLSSEEAQALGLAVPLPPMHAQPPKQEF